MIVHVLSHQIDERAMRLLSPHAQLRPAPTADLDQLSTLQGPLAVLGTALQTQAAVLPRLCQAIYRQPHPLLFLPPWPACEVNLTAVLDAPVQVELRGKRNDQIQVLDGELQAALGQEKVRIRSDQVIDTSLSAGVMARNGEGQPVLLWYRPTNRSTPVYVTTLQLLAHSSRSDSLMREKFLLALLKQMSAGQSEHQAPLVDHSPKPPSIPEAILRAVVVALAVTDPVTVPAVQHTLVTQLFTHLTSDQVEAALDYLADVGCVMAVGEGLRRNSSVLDTWIDRLGARAYVRELQRVK